MRRGRMMESQAPTVAARELTGSRASAISRGDASDRSTSRSYRLSWEASGRPPNRIRSRTNSNDWCCVRHPFVVPVSHWSEQCYGKKDNDRERCRKCRLDNESHETISMATAGGSVPPETVADQ